MHKVSIREVRSTGGVRQAARIVRKSFATVAAQFGLSGENCPTHPAFLTDHDLADEMASGLCIYRLALHGKWVGIVGIRMMSRRRYSIEKLAVLPDYRHRGHGAALVSFACEAARALGADVVRIGIIDEHEALKNWYIEQGFAVKLREQYERLPFAVCILEKRL
jgi:ribosomal protein S18 acetylase RimI-like enzyme